MRRAFFRLIAPGLMLAVLAACAPTPKKEAEKPAPSAPPAVPRVVLTPVEYAGLPGWNEDFFGQALPALKRSCDIFLRQADDKPVGNGGIFAGLAKDWRGPCAEAARLSETDHAGLRQLLEARFRPYKVGDGSAGGKTTGTFTGYYEIELRASTKPGPKFRAPILAPPDDLVTVDLGLFKPELGREQIIGRVDGNRLKPYWNRAEIDGGAVKGRTSELYWAEDAVDVFMLHIQGSGRLLLEDGRVQRVGFANSNGHRFVGIGKLMIDRGIMRGEDMSMQAIRDWLRVNPGPAAKLMAENPRYIFFRRIEGDGPIGAQNVALTAGRSLAVDSGLLPLGAPFWLDTRAPDGKPFRRLMLAQDVGAAIKGAVRGDIFWGTGEAALNMAGRMKSPGEYYLLLPSAVSILQ